jgi:NAD(P)-dependent dehydrogenase (short-subunit alcohol dehydrogenase family)
MGNFNRLATAAAAGLGAAFALRALAGQARQFNFTGSAVVITGGSRGLGLAVARALAAEGARLALLAEDPGELSRAEIELSAAGAEVYTLPCDIRDQSAVQSAIDRVARRYGSVDVLINNAGIIQVGPIEHMRLEDFEDAMGVHLWGPLYAILAALPYMRRHGGGRIVNISSVGGKIAVPHLVPYSTSKFALVGLSDGLRAELAKDGIRVTTVCPGLMRTGSHANAFFKGRHRAEYTWFAILDALPVTSTDVRSAARQIVESCRAGAPELIITPQARLAIKLQALFPNLTAHLLNLVGRLLPRPLLQAGAGQAYFSPEAWTGWDSTSTLAPSVLTLLADRATVANNEVTGKAPEHTGAAL